VSGWTNVRFVRVPAEADLLAEQSLDQAILAEIRERLKKSRAAADEYQRLEAALAALTARPTAALR
jgi:hypothetical protein